MTFRNATAWVRGPLVVMGVLMLSGAARGDEAPPAELPALPEEESGLDVLTRGPVHDAFAEPVAKDPTEGIVVPKAPPAPVEEVPPDVKPEGDDVVWIPGYWFWDDEREDYVWVSGVWRRAPPDRRWVPGYWQEVEGGHQWVPGFWAAAEKPEVEYVEPPPESLEVGPSGPAPSEDHFWIPGCWLSVNRVYQWRPGFWHPFHTSWSWVPSRYVWTPRGCIYVNGYWDYPLARRGCLFAPVYFRRPLYLRAGFVYRPRCWIGYDSLLLHLFIRPARHHYFFGDYYGLSYRRSYHPCADYFVRRRGFCSVYTYYHHHYRRQGIDYVGRVRSWHRYYANHRDYRPPHTWLKQRGHLRGHHTGHLAAYNRLGRELREPDKLVKRARLRTDDLERARRHSHELRQLVQARRRLESPTANPVERRRGKPGGPARPTAKFALPRSSDPPATGRRSSRSVAASAAARRARAARTLAERRQAGESAATSRQRSQIAAGARREWEARGGQRRPHEVDRPTVDRPIVRGQNAGSGQSSAARLPSARARAFESARSRPPAARHEVDRTLTDRLQDALNRSRDKSTPSGPRRSGASRPSSPRSSSLRDFLASQRGLAAGSQPASPRGTRSAGAANPASEARRAGPSATRKAAPPTSRRSRLTPSPQARPATGTRNPAPAAARNAAPPTSLRSRVVPRPSASPTRQAPRSFSGPRPSAARAARPASRSPRSFSGPRPGSSRASAPAGRSSRSFSGPRPSAASRSAAPRGRSLPSARGGSSPRRSMSRGAFKGFRSTGRGAASRASAERGAGRAAGRGRR